MAKKVLKKKVEAKKVAPKTKTTKESVPKVKVANKIETNSKKPSTPLDRAMELIKGNDYQKALDRLQYLRKEGEWKLLRIKDENINIKINKQMGKEGKKKLLELNKGEMAVAKGIAAQNKPETKSIINNTRQKLNDEFAPIFLEAKAKEKEQIARAKEEYENAIAKAQEEYKNDLVNLEKKINKGDNNKDKKVDLNAIKISYRSKLNAAKNTRFSTIEVAKEERYQTYQVKHEYLNALCLNKVGEIENSKYGFETYIRNFNFVNWITKNALLIIVFVLFLIMLILMGAKGNITSQFFLGALSQIAPKIFFALGVAGLILLGGTDLSIGRLTAVGASFTLMILTTDPVSLSWFPHLANASLAAKVPLAIIISVLICTVFTTISGFFTAKFKMHPFISTLAIQLIVYGLFQAFFSSVSAFTIDTTIQEAIGGKGNWLLIIYAAIAIAVVWFIWNKTKFGKNLYAVGGNPEAATVSGINPFKITMLAFIMAGILYGLGGFVQGIQGASANFNSYNGTETDAIAACVIGGISFSGGVGNVLGAVGGAVILGFLTSCFNNLGIDVNLQFVIKGLIILTAVTLDCVKYIRKK